VIAFPVSVFSELWSKELKANGAYRSISMSESIEDKYENIDEVSNGEVTPPKFISAVLDRSDLNISNTNILLDHDNDSNDSLIFKARDEPNAEYKIGMSDVQAIRHYMSVIDDAQGKIQGLLQNMDIAE